MATSYSEELYNDVIMVRSKIYYLDLKRNVRGTYLKLSEKGKYRSKSSVVIPSSGFDQFFELFDYYLNSFEGQTLGENRDMIVDSKVFSFITGENERGKYLRIQESGGRNPSGRSSLLVPVDENNTVFKLLKLSFDHLLFTIQEAKSISINAGRILDERNSMVRVAADPGTSDATESVSLNISKEGMPVVSVGNGKYFFVSHCTNDRGEYLKIKEVSGAMRNTIVVPVAAVPKFQEALSLSTLAKPIVDTTCAERTAIAASNDSMNQMPINPALSGLASALGAGSIGVLNPVHQVMDMNAVMAAAAAAVAAGHPSVSLGGSIGMMPAPHPVALAAHPITPASISAMAQSLGLS